MLWLFLLPRSSALWSSLISVSPQSPSLCSHHFYPLGEGTILSANCQLLFQTLLSRLPGSKSLICTECVCGLSCLGNTPQLWCTRISLHVSQKACIRISALSHITRYTGGGSGDGDSTGLSIKRVSVNLPTPWMSGQNKSPFFIVLIYAWPKQTEELTKSYRCSWWESVVFIKTQYILTIMTVKNLCTYLLHRTILSNTNSENKLRKTKQ